MMKAFLNVTMSENDTRMLIILLIILLLFFIIVGLVGMAIRKVSQLQADVIDQQMGELVRYRIVSDPVHFKKLATQKNNRLLVKKAAAPLTIGFVGLLFYLIYAGVSGQWGRDYWGEFGTLFFLFDFKNATYSNFWGLKNVLIDWPPVISPAPQLSFWPSYILCPLVVVAVTYYIIVIQGYFSRFVYLRRIGKEVFKVSLKGYNYYDHIGTDAYGRPLNPSEMPIKPGESAKPVDPKAK